MSDTKQKIFHIMQIGNRGDIPSRTFDFFIVAVILINIAVLFLETFSVFDPYYPLLRAIETITIIIFIAEYLLRLWTADLLYPEYNKGKSMLRFAGSFEGVVLLLTILPFFFLNGFVALQILRVIRIFRLFKINATSDSFTVIAAVLKKKRNQIISSVFIILILMLIASLCMYSVEHPVQPEAYKNAFSGIWWTVSTIFTVGYGDIYPITVVGRILAIIITFLGVGAVAIPTGIISAGFVEQYTQMSQARKQRTDTRHAICESVGHHSPYINMSLKELEKKYEFDILAIQRDGEILIPGNTTQIREDDILIGQRLGDHPFNPD